MTAFGLPIVDAWAVVCATIAAFALALRGEILKPEMGTFFTGPGVVRLSLTLTSIALGGRVVSVLAGNHAQAAEAAVYTALAWCAGVMLWNLQRNRPEGEL